MELEHIEPLFVVVSDVLDLIRSFCFLDEIKARTKTDLKMSNQIS